MNQLYFRFGENAANLVTTVYKTVGQSAYVGFDLDIEGTTTTLPYIGTYLFLFYFFFLFLFLFSFYRILYRKYLPIAQYCFLNTSDLCKLFVPLRRMILFHCNFAHSQALPILEALTVS